MTTHTARSTHPARRPDPAGDGGPRVDPRRDPRPRPAPPLASPTARSPASPAASARHLDVDPLILRVAFVVLVFFGGAGLILYGACWLLVPEEGDRRGAAQPRRAQPHRRAARRRRARRAGRWSATRGAASGSPGRWRSSRWSSLWLLTRKHQRPPRGHGAAPPGVRRQPRRPRPGDRGLHADSPSTTADPALHRHRLPAAAAVRRRPQQPRATARTRASAARSCSGSRSR